MISTPTTTFDRIRTFWDQRAKQFGADGPATPRLSTPPPTTHPTPTPPDHPPKQFGADSRATLRETPLRELDVRAMMRKLSQLRPRRVLDFAKVSFAEGGAAVSAELLGALV